MLREAFRAWLMEHLPWPYGVGLPPRFDDLAETVAFGRRWQGDLAADGWVGITWPQEYGGRGLGALENYVVIEELARARAPELVGRIGINLVGPTLLAHGTAEQKERFLPRILSADELWCQLFSEPDAGSDLASLTTRAVRDEGGYRVTGRKVWTSYAQFADWGLCLTRTDPDAAEAPAGHHRARHRHARRGRGRAPARAVDRRGRVQRGRAGRRLRARRTAGRRRGRGVDRRRVHAGARTRASTRASSSSIRSSSRSSCAWRTRTGASTTGGYASSWRRRRPRSGSSSCTTGAR